MSFFDETAINEARHIVVAALAAHLPVSSQDIVRGEMLFALERLEQAVNNNRSAEIFADLFQDCINRLADNEVEVHVLLSLLEKVALAPLTLPLQEVFLATCSLMIFSVLSERILVHTFETQRDLSAFKERVFQTVQHVFDVSFDVLEQEVDGPGLVRAARRCFTAFMEDLAARLESLPNIITYNVAIGRASIDLAHRLYGDAGRADELERFNRVANPLFMPLEGEGLSA